MSTETDIVIVGAGAAGIAAGVRLKAAGVRFVIVEAQARIGGRAWTDDAALPGVAFDRGCHWLHEAATNPYRAIADELGYAYDTGFRFDTRTYFLGGRWASAAEADGIVAALDDAYRRIHEAGDRGLDVAAARVLDGGGPWHPYIDLVIGLDTSATPETVSVADMTGGVRIGDDFPVEAGYGALVAAYGRGLDVALATPVTAIDWSGKGVTVTTARGTIRARAAIVTVSTSVLAQGGIRFTPALPDDTRAAIESLPLGCCEKVAFLLDAPLGDFPSCHTAGIDDPELASRRPTSLYLNPFGRPLAIVHYGGSYAADLARAGDAAAIAFGLEALVAAAGSDVRDRVRGAAATGWLADPFVRGAYSAALPGAAGSRAVLARPVGGRILFAGEAASPDAYASCHGAHASGIAAAERAVAALGWSRNLL
jgi:monoamine oxidase